MVQKKEILILKIKLTDRYVTQIINHRLVCILRKDLLYKPYFTD